MRDRQAAVQASSMASSILEQALMARAAHEEGIACGLPQEVYSHEKGFTWANELQDIRSEGNEKEAVCVRSTIATMVTQ